MKSRPRLPLSLIACFALVGLLLLAPAARAGDMAELEIVGFSPDGETFAYEQYGISDGSGFPWVEIRFVDTWDDCPAAPPIRLEDEEEGALESLRTAARTRAVPTFRKLGLMSAVDGESLFSRPVAGDLFSFQALTTARVALLGDPMDLQVVETPVADGNEDPFTGGGAALRLVAVEPVSGVSIVLHDDDGVLPPERAAARDYSIVAVRKVAEGHVVVLAYRVPAFEGPSLRYMAVGFSL